MSKTVTPERSETLKYVLFNCGIAFAVLALVMFIFGCASPAKPTTAYPFPQMLDPVTGQAPVISHSGPTTPITNAIPVKGACL